MGNDESKITHVKEQYKTCNEWNELTLFVSSSPKVSWLHRSRFSMCSYYVDIHGKEWIIILLAPRTVSGCCDSYLYDVENDKFMPFIKNYDKDINKKFNICHVLSDGSVHCHSYAIDNNNHILYWLQSSYKQRSLLSIDIKNLKDIKLIDQTLLTNAFCIDGARLLECHYKMLIVGNTIQFILGDYNIGDEETLLNVQFDIKTKKLSLIHKNIHLKSVDRKLKLDNLKIGDCIDVQNNLGNWVLAQIVKIKNKKYCQCNEKDIDIGLDKENIYNNKVVCSMHIYVHYVGWTVQWDEWVYISEDMNLYSSQELDRLKTTMESELLKSWRHQDDHDWFKDTVIHDVHSVAIDEIINKLKNGTSICDCSGKCIYHAIKSKVKTFASSITKECNKCHRIALAQTKSLEDKSLRNLHGLYSKNAKTMIILGHNGESEEEKMFGGLYCKRLYYDENNCRYIINGFIKQFEQLFIPKDLRQMILKYYFIPNDKNWTCMTKKDKNGELIPLPNDAAFQVMSCYTVINDPNLSDNKHITIYKFGSYSSSTLYASNRDAINRIDIDVETHSYKITQLTSIKCPKLSHNQSFAHVVFCQKSKTIHLFEKAFARHYSIKLQTLTNAQTVQI